MKIKLLTISLGFMPLVSYAQSNFTNLWKMQNTKDNIEIKIFENKQELNFVLDGLIDNSSRIYITGEMLVTGLNQYKYQDKNSDCSLLFNFVNNDSAYVQSNLCELYTLNDSINGLFTSNYENLLTTRILSEYNEAFENEIKQKTGEHFNVINAKSKVKKEVLIEGGKIIFMAENDKILENDPQIAYFIKDEKVSIFHREDAIVTTFQSPFHFELPEVLLTWIQKLRLTSSVIK